MDGRAPRKINRYKLYSNIRFLFLPLVDYLVYIDIFIDILLSIWNI